MTEIQELSPTSELLTQAELIDQIQLRVDNLLASATTASILDGTVIADERFAGVITDYKGTLADFMADWPELSDSDEATKRSAREIVAMGHIDYHIQDRTGNAAVERLIESVCKGEAPTTEHWQALAVAAPKLSDATRAEQGAALITLASELLPAARKTDNVPDISRGKLDHIVKALDYINNGYAAHPVRLLDQQALLRATKTMSGKAPSQSALAASARKTASLSERHSHKTVTAAEQAAHAKLCETLVSIASSKDDTDEETKKIFTQLHRELTTVKFPKEAAAISPDVAAIDAVASRHGLMRSLISRSRRQDNPRRLRLAETEDDNFPVTAEQRQAAEELVRKLTGELGGTEDDGSVKKADLSHVTLRRLTGAAALTAITATSIALSTGQAAASPAGGEHNSSGDGNTPASHSKVETTTPSNPGDVTTESKQRIQLPAADSKADHHDAKPVQTEDVTLDTGATHETATPTPQTQQPAVEAQPTSTDANQPSATGSQPAKAHGEQYAATEAQTAPDNPDQHPSTDAQHPQAQPDHGHTQHLESADVNLDLPADAVTQPVSDSPDTATPPGQTGSGSTAANNGEAATIADPSPSKSTPAHKEQAPVVAIDIDMTAPTETTDNAAAFAPTPTPDVADIKETAQKTFEAALIDRGTKLVDLYEIYKPKIAHDTTINDAVVNRPDIKANIIKQAQIIDDEAVKNNVSDAVLAKIRRASLLAIATGEFPKLGFGVDPNKHIYGDNPVFVNVQGTAISQEISPSTDSAIFDFSADNTVPEVTATPVTPTLDGSAQTPDPTKQIGAVESAQIADSNTPDGSTPAQGIAESTDTTVSTTQTASVSAVAPDPNFKPDNPEATVSDTLQPDDVTRIGQMLAAARALALGSVDNQLSLLDPADKAKAQAAIDMLNAAKAKAAAARAAAHNKEIPHAAPKQESRPAPETSAERSDQIAVAKLVKFGIKAEYAHYYVTYAKMYHLSPYFLTAAQGKQESGNQQNPGTSSGGAVGIAQFLPSTWAGVRDNLHAQFGDKFPADASPMNPKYAIWAQSYYMNAMRNDMKNLVSKQPGHDIITLMLRAYNGGENGLEKSHGEPLSQENEEYPIKIAAIMRDIQSIQVTVPHKAETRHVPKHKEAMMTITAKRNLIVSTAEKFANPPDAPDSINNPDPDYKKELDKIGGAKSANGADCAEAVEAVMQATGLDKGFNMLGTWNQYTHMKSNPQTWHHAGLLTSEKQLKPGDVLSIGREHGQGAAGHTAIYLGNGKVYMASWGDFQPKITTLDGFFHDGRGKFDIFRFIGK